MARISPTTDPYRVLGILRGARPEHIKAAHRLLAKRYHPDGSTGDEQRFLAIQEAYQLLSDPVRRQAWDRAHAPGPVRAAGGRPRVTVDAADDDRQRRGAARFRRARPTPGQRTRTWTAERVPWWEDFRPGTKPAPDPTPEPQVEEHDDFDVFNRSSGAAWSSAARRHFRRGTDDLPSRGVWRYRGTQVVTGAEARKVAAEEEEENSRR